MTGPPKIGPGVIVAAAFIGPGTVTTATLAGAHSGVQLLWALAFATLATMVLQEMSARLGLVSGSGLAQALRAVGGPPWLGPMLAGLGVGAVVVGAMAFQAGNLTGAALGLSNVLPGGATPWILLSAGVSCALLWTGHYRLVERTLAVCVAVMGLTFLTTALLVLPALSDLVRGALIPTVPEGGWLTALGLVGTTIVPYNLFLHAAAVRERWNGPEDLRAARWDLALAIGLGGIVSAAVLITAQAALGGADVQSASDMAAQLAPVLGEWSAGAFSVGFGAAGVSSAITAPLAAAYATADLLRGDRSVQNPASRVVWGSTIAVGTVVALLGLRPVPLILLAQVANGALLPVVALVLVLAVNNRQRLGSHVNGWKGNIAGGLVLVVCTVLGIRTLVNALF